MSEQDCDKFTVIFYQGQEYFKVAVMELKNSLAYVQKKIDIIFRLFQKFAQAYIDDIVIFFTSFEEHVAHLHCIFSFFQSIGIRLNPKKSYFGYLSVQLFGQKVTRFRLTTSKEKIAAIAKLTFPTTSKALKTYF